MIQDSDTNILYLSDTIPKFHPGFFERFRIALRELNIPHALLPDTKDIWAKDFMPVQLDRSEYIQFVYDPDYLKKPEYQHLLTDSNCVCDAIELRRKKSQVVLDGGNVIRSADKVLLCEKVFKENPNRSRSELTDELVELFKTDKIIFLPWDKNDFTGHADGMVHFVDEHTVIINEATGENLQFEKKLRTTLKNARLTIIELPYSPPDDPTYLSAKGLHLNFLQMKQGIIVPVFEQSTDERAVQTIENTFTGQMIIALNCEEIAAAGGVLNCISWNIVK